MNDTLTIVATIVAKPAHRESVKASLLKLIPVTLKERGCIQYDLHEDLEDENRFLFFENWESKSLWEEHMQTPHIKAYMEETEGMVETFTLYQMNKSALT